MTLTAQESTEQPAPPPVVDAARELRAREREQHCREDPRVVLGQVSYEICLGAELFFRETFGGNGRTCSSCHPAANNYTLDADYVAQLSPSDPLFIAEQAPELSELEIPELMRGYGLILVNPDGLDDPTHRFVVRSVPHILGLSTSTRAPELREGSTTRAFDGTVVPPIERLGWSGDGSPGTGELRDFADGAIRQHATRSLERREGVDFTLPSDEERDAMAAFQRVIGRTTEVDMSSVRLSDVGAERGRVTFLTGNGKECSTNCHSNAGANVFRRDDDGVPLRDENGELLPLINTSRDIGTAVIRPPEVDALNVPLDGGNGVRPLDLDFDGVLDSFGIGAMNVPPLIEAADTGPFFSTHAFATLEEAIAFYAGDGFAHSFVGANLAFENRPAGEPMPLSPDDILDIGRFLRVANAALNVQMARARADAAREIVAQFGTQSEDVQLGLIRLAREEADDALRVLDEAHCLAPAQQEQLRRVREALSSAERQRHCGDRERLLRSAVRRLGKTLDGLGTGLEMEIGPGTLMY